MGEINNLENWKSLQENGYFKKHRCYKDFQIIENPKYINKSDVRFKTIVEIGCGYGRETVFFSKYAKFVYAIDVCDSILAQNKKFVRCDGFPTQVKHVLAENYQSIIPDEIDVVYSCYVFQHLTPEQVKDYIDTFYGKLKKGGLFVAQFNVGTTKQYPEGKEPIVKYTLDEINKFFEKFTTVNLITTSGKVSTRKYIHAIVRAVK